MKGNSLIYTCFKIQRSCELYTLRIHGTKYSRVNPSKICGRQRLEKLK